MDTKVILLSFALVSTVCAFETYIIKDGSTVEYRLSQFERWHYPALNVQTKATLQLTRNATSYQGLYKDFHYERYAFDEEPTNKSLPLNDTETSFEFTFKSNQEFEIEYGREAWSSKGRKYILAKDLLLVNNLTTKFLRGDFVHDEEEIQTNLGLCKANFYDLSQKHWDHWEGKITVSPLECSTEGNYQKNAKNRIEIRVIVEKDDNVMRYFEKVEEYYKDDNLDLERIFKLEMVEK